MIQVYDIYCAFYFYYYYISSTSDHQALDPRGWGPLEQSTTRLDNREKRPTWLQNCSNTELIRVTRLQVWETHHSTPGSCLPSQPPGQHPMRGTLRRAAANPPEEQEQGRRGPDVDRAAGMPPVTDAAVANFLINSPVRCKNSHKVMLTHLVSSFHFRSTLKEKTLRRTLISVL